MARTSFESVDDYLAIMPPSTRAVLDEVRSIVRAALPDADEVISYQIPVYKQAGVAVIYLAGWKRHFSLYPVGEALVERLSEAARYPISKGTIKFPLDEEVPRALIRKIVMLQQKEAARAEGGSKGGEEAGGWSVWQEQALGGPAMHERRPAAWAGLLANLSNGMPAAAIIAPCLGHLAGTSGPSGDQSGLRVSSR
jgi:uncharacterized protein YdhG (YjbR/CyaY superfamily)